MKKWVRQRLASYNSLKCGVSSVTPPPSSQRDIMLGVSSSPARSLPTELLVKILLHCSDVDIFDLRPPLYLAQICYLWRSIALSTPQIWAEIPLLLDTPHNNKKDNVTFFEDYLTRSNPCPLSIHLMSLSSISSAKRRDLCSAPVFSVLIKDSHRWKKATLTADFEGFCQFNRVPLPALELLYLKFHEYDSYIDQRAVSNITIVKIKYPQLSKLIISSLSSTSQALNLVLSRLVVPSLQELRVSQFYDSSNPTLVSTIQGLVLQSGCNLLCLDLRNLSGSSLGPKPGDLARLLAHTPLLQELYYLLLNSSNFNLLRIKKSIFPCYLIWASHAVTLPRRWLTVP
ncbi:hypothetical protein BDQ17DRAFT_673609 [Cyathus striatus]|nr:hypothetical protein BDQ17DRAFT_673609 [Cyathus striatus]